MFGLSVGSQIIQGSTVRTWNCVVRIASLFWDKFHHLRHPIMPRTRKRHHSHSKSRSRSPSREKSPEVQRKVDAHEKDGKRRKVETVESPQHKRSVSSELLVDKPEDVQTITAEETQVRDNSEVKQTETKEDNTEADNQTKINEEEANASVLDDSKMDVDDIKDNTQTEDEANVSVLDDSKLEVTDSETEKDKSLLKINTPKKPLTPKQIQKRLESEKKRIERMKEREEQRKQKEEEKERLRQEKIKQKQEKEAEKEAERLKKEAEKQKAIEQKQKEKEMKEEMKRKEKEEKEQKKKEKLEQEELKRKEREQEKLKKQQEIDEKNKKEEEKKQKAAAAFANFFVAKKQDLNTTQDENKKTESVTSNFMPFEIKSDMRLPPNRRTLTEAEKKIVEDFIENQKDEASYIKDLKSGKAIGKSFKTWPYEESEDVTIIEEGNLGETICEDASTKKKMKAKFLMFHENKRPPYFGTFRKQSKYVNARKPFGEDKDMFNYEEDSDDDWEEEEQGESLNGSDEEADKENEDEKDDYEVDNEFFVPHGHLSDDEVDDEENARLSPESLKQKLKLLHDEFEEDMKCKTRKLKPRSIGCIWYNKDGSNVEESIHRYLEPFAIITSGQILIKKRCDIFNNTSNKKVRVHQELPSEYVPVFLKVIHGNVNNQKVLIEQFMTQMVNNGMNVSTSKSALIRNLKQMATWKKCQQGGSTKNKFAWFVNDDIKEKYNVDLVLPNKTDS